MEDDRHPELTSQKFEQVGEIFKCRECGEEKSKHSLIINCPEIESTKKKRCFRCHHLFSRQYVFAKRNYSFKNNWDYWTEKEENKDKFICNSCLLNLYYNDKAQYLQEVQTKKKRQIFKVYVYNKILA